MKLKLALTTATFLAMPILAPTIARAQPVTGPYISGGAGYNIELKQNLKDGVVGNYGVNGVTNVGTKNGIMG